MYAHVEEVVFHHVVDVGRNEDEVHAAESHLGDAQEYIYQCPEIKNILLLDA